MKMYNLSKTINLTILWIFLTTSYIHATNSPFDDYTGNYDQLLMPPNNVSKFYEILKTTDSIFNDHGIKYWVDGGTLLGAIRHQGFIPWDSDIDIEVFEDDYDNILALKELFLEHGYDVLHWNWGGLLIRSKKNSGIKIDVFLTKIDEDKIVLAKQGPRLNYHGNFFYLSEVANSTRLPFGPIEVNAPINGIRYLLTYYGEYALTHAMISGDKTLYRIIDFSPAVFEPSETLKMIKL